ncbi:MAG: mannitol dehydrogenase family protein [Cyanobacteria bacterium J06634_5]
MKPIPNPSKQHRSSLPLNPLPSAKPAIRLSERTLAELPDLVRSPHYPREKVTTGIVHIGVGGFHRAHQALYLDNYIEQEIAKSSQSDWGICGVGLLKYDQKMKDVLQSQDCLYTLVERSPKKDTARIIGAIGEYIFAPDDPQVLIKKLADPLCKIVMLTITEGGYYVIEGTGEFDEQNSTIQHDLQHPESPIGVYGFLTAALNQRKEGGLAPFTILSCDNIQGNGNMARKMLTAFATLQDPNLAQWIDQRVTFPNSMVDRITPATTPADIQMVSDQFAIKDGWPVVAEPFLQWVVEDKFCAGRPDWENVGVQMTDDVHPYEQMKIRLLNASHLLIGYLGSLLGYTYTSEAMENDLIRAATERLMNEVSPTLQTLPGVDVADYKQTLLARFSNPKVRDQLSRLCLNSSDKLPKFLLGSLRDNLEKNRSVEYASLTIAAWFYYLGGKDKQGKALPIDDLMADILVERAEAGGDNPMPLLTIKALFGDLSESKKIAAAVKQHLQQLYRLGTHEALTQILAK